jgi:glycosyltransferase involved in cell wall biosynthesis
MRILIWHVHGSYLTAFVQGSHEYVLPKLPNRHPDGFGRADTWDWPTSAVEAPPEVLREQDFDVVVLQRPHELALASEWLGRRPGRDLPAVYLEHNTPEESACGERHFLADQREIGIVHVTDFNDLMWDTGDARTVVVPHGVLDPGYRYTGELAAGGVVVNEPGRRGRMVGADLVPRFASAGPVDVFGMKAESFAAELGLGDRVRGFETIRTQDEMHTELARRRAYLHLTRWTSLGLSLIEAMMLGMPVIALATTEASQAIPAIAGCVSTRVENLIQQFGVLLQDRDAAVAAGSAGRQAALAQFGIGRFLSDWDRVLFEESDRWKGERR